MLTSVGMEPKKTEKMRGDRLKRVVRPRFVASYDRTHHQNQGRLFRVADKFKLRCYHILRIEISNFKKK